MSREASNLVVLVLSDDLEDRDAVIAGRRCEFLAVVVELGVVNDAVVLCLDGDKGCSGHLDLGSSAMIKQREMRICVHCPSQQTPETKKRRKQKPVLPLECWGCSSTTYNHDHSSLKLFSTKISAETLQ